MLFKLLLLGGFIAAVYYAFFKKSALPNSQKNEKRLEEPMIACVICGTYVDSKETFMRDERHYCSRECMKTTS